MNQYYDEEATRFIETICIFATLDAQHRFVVRALARLLNFHVLAKQKNIRASLCELLSESYIIIFFISFFFFLKQACVKLHDAKDPVAPEKVLCWIVDGSQPESVLWNLSWALNSIGHSVISLTTYDWIMAVKHARAMM